MTYPSAPASPPRAGQGAVQLAGHDCLAENVPRRPQEVHQGAGLRPQASLLVPDGVAAPLCRQLQRTQGSLLNGEWVGPTGEPGRHAGLTVGGHRLQTPHSALRHLLMFCWYVSGEFQALLSVADCVLAPERGLQPRCHQLLRVDVT